MEVILEKISTFLSKGTFNDQVAAEYAKSLYEGTKHSILETTKFEEFLGNIQFVVGRPKLDELLRILYLCQDKEYGPNQSAISWLLQKRICSICLTTNFDNSIENASKNIVTYTHLNYPKDISVNNKIPIQLKLHGDVNNNSCVATNRTMFEVKSLASYEFLKNLLNQQNILVLGYSGDGDIDISPHLYSTNAKFLWCEYIESKPVPPFAEYKVICDLSSNDPNKNLLIGLAKYYGWNYTLKNKNHDWKDKLEKWCGSIERTKLANIVVRTLFGKPGWPVIHLTQLYPYKLVSDNYLINKGVACLQTSAYWPAEKIFLEIINSSNLSHNQLITARVYLGFIQWRKGKFEKALRTLWWFYSIDPSNYNEEEKNEIGNGLRIYLEVARDWMQLRTFIKCRRKIYQKKRLGNVIEKLKKIPTFDFKEDILKKIVILHIYYLNGISINISEVEDLYYDSYNTKNWSTAEAVGRLLISLSFLKGLRALLKVDYKLIQRRQWNTLRKSLAAILNKLTGEFIPIIILNIIDGPLLSIIVAPIRDWRYRKKVAIWNKQKNRRIIKII